MIRETISWLNNGWDRTKPFMAFVWMHEPHVPVRTDLRFKKLYAELGEAADTLRFGGEQVDRSAANKAARERYFGAVTQMDFEIGKLLAQLDKLEVTDNTLVYFVSDNGPEHRYDTSWGSPGPYRGAKGHIHEGGIRVPGIVRWPGRIPPGSICAEPVNGTDLLPTLCAAAGIEPALDVTIDGVNMLPAWTECLPLEREKPLFWWLFHARGGKQTALRIGDYKILAHMTHPDQPTLKDLFPPEGTGLMDFIKHTGIEGFQLYDVVRDPGETHELSKEQPQLFETMRKQLLATYDEIQKEGPWWTSEGIGPEPKRE